MTAKQKRALNAGLVKVLFNLIEEGRDKLVTDAQWETDDETGPTEYWTEEAENYLHKKITAAIKSAAKGVTG